MNYELLFPVWYKQDFRELMEYIDSQFEKLSSENDSKYNELTGGCEAYSGA